MKQIIALLFAYILTATSCQKIVDDPVVERPGGVDSTGKKLYIQYKEVWGSTDNSATDSLITNYTFNSSGLLMEENSIKYYRDNKGRVGIIAGLGINDSVFTDVHYADEISGTIAYTVSHEKKIGSKIVDSTVYIYDAGKLIKTMFFTFSAGAAVLGGYYVWAYDSKNNISQLTVYSRDAGGNYEYSYSCDFSYDDKTNPFYTTDQVRQCIKWWLSSSPNNLLKQVNHYSTNSSLPDDYYNILYTYDLDGRPLTSFRSGPTIGTSVVHASYYYY